MNNKPIVLSVGGVSYPAKYTFQSYVDMHEKHGVNVFDLANPSPKQVSVLTWGAISHAAPTITPDEITAKISMEEAMNNLNICVEAIMASMPKKAATNESAKPA